MKTITRQDVVDAAADKGIRVLEALSMMQAACATLGDEEILSQLCAVKNELLFGDN